MIRKTKLDEDELRRCIKAIAERRDEEWECLWDSFLGFRIQNYCRRTADGTEKRLESLNWKELHQEINFNIYQWSIRNSDNLDDIESVESKLWRIARNTCAKELNKVLQGGIKEEISDCDIDKIVDIFGEIDDYDCLLTLMDNAKLNNDERTIIIAIREGRKVSEISKEVNCSKNTIKTRLRRALLKMKNAKKLTECLEKTKILPIKAEK